MEEDELNFVAPGRRAEVRRRLTAIRRYIGNPCRAEAEEAIKELGMSWSNFHIMVQIFRRTGDPATIAGAKRERVYRERLEPDFRTFLDRILEGYENEPERDLLKAIKAEAALRGVALPYDPTLRKYIRRKFDRRADEELTLGAEFALDFCVLKLPVIDEQGQIGRPAAALVIDLVSRRLAGLALATTPPDIVLMARALRAAATSANVSKAPPIVLSLDGVGESPLPCALSKAGLDVRIRPDKRTDQGKIAFAELQQKVADIKLERQKIWYPFSDRPTLVPPRDRALTIQEAEEFLAAREQHLRGMSTLPIPGAHFSSLVQDLQEIIASTARPI